MGETNNDNNPSIWINPSSQSIIKGEIFCIDVHIDSGSKSIRTIGVQLTYPSPHIHFSELIDHNLLGTAVIPVGGNIAPGLINYAVARQNINTATPINNKFITLCFSTTNSSEAVYPLTFIQVDLLDENGQRVSEIEINHGQVSVINDIYPLMATCGATPPGINPVINAPIMFTSEVTGGKPPYTYHWIFGDGHSSNKKNVNYSYTQPGTYAVNYTVTDTLMDIYQCNLLLTVSSIGNTLPTVDITHPKKNDTLTGTVNIAGNSMDRDGSIKKIEIKFDDHQWLLANGTTNWHYSWDTLQVENGQHTISVRAYDEQDHSHPLTIMINVNNTETNNGKTPGFQAILGIISFSLIYLAIRKKEDKENH